MDKYYYHPENYHFKIDSEWYKADEVDAAKKKDSAFIQEFVEEAIEKDSIIIRRGAYIKKLEKEITQSRHAIGIMTNSTIYMRRDPLYPIEMAIKVRKHIDELEQIVREGE